MSRQFELFETRRCHCGRNGLPFTWGGPGGNLVWLCNLHWPEIVSGWTPEEVAARQCQAQCQTTAPKSAEGSATSPEGAARAKES